MSITNEDRYNLQTKANDLLGRKEGATLMELLPPVGWADVATKRDLDQLEERLIAKFELRFGGIDSRMSRIDQRFDGIDQRFDGIDQRFDGIDQRFDGLDQTIRTALAEQNAAIQTDLRKMQGMLLSAMVALATLATAILAVTR